MEREWFYLSGGVQTGPLSQSQFDQYVASGTVRVETPVWTQGLAGWAPYGTLPQNLDAPELLNLLNCSYCGRLFSSEDLVQFSDRRVCAQCKPLYLQQLREGVQPIPHAGSSSYGLRAGFWIRVGAKMIDGVVLWIFNSVVGLAVMLSPLGAGLRNFNPDKPEFGMALLVAYLVMIFLQITSAATYNTVMVAKYGATLGKMACRLQVVTPTGKPTYLRAFGRYGAEIVSGMTLGIGYLMVVFDEEKRALHDRICNTWVIHSA